MPIETLSYTNGVLTLIDQTLLPTEFVHIDCRDVATVWEAIKSLRVRGAPAIGIAAAYGVCVGLREVGTDMPSAKFFARLEEVTTYLASSRPTAVNLFWAIDRMKKVVAPLRKTNTTNDEVLKCLEQEAAAIHEEDRCLCRAIGHHGAALFKDGTTFLTHCNAGGLATADYGTALAVFFAATESGKKIRVFADETRPLLQGARLTAWELKEHKISVTLICDNMAAMVMKQGKIDAVVVGADRIASNGDAANKIGTYAVAVMAKYHNVPFYVAAPFSTFDMTLADGSGIPIEERDPREITNGFNKQTAPNGINVYNPAFDVTPAELITGIITEKGVITTVNKEAIRNMRDK
jgi:methylthioribose-1-phosphate isomerase